MDFELSHHLAFEPRAVAAVLLDEDYQTSLSDVGGLKGRTVLSQRAGSGGTVVRHTRCVLDVELAGPVRRLVGDGEPAWVEEAIWHPDELRWDWEVKPEIGADLLEARGTIRLEAGGGGTARRIQGKVVVRVPLYGGRIESLIVDGLRRAYDEEAERLTAWLARVTLL